MKNGRKLGALVLAAGLMTVQARATSLSGQSVGGKVAAGKIVASMLAAGAVTSAAIGALSIDTTKIAVDAIDSTKILTNAVTTAKIAALAVDTSKIAANAIDTTKLNPPASGSGTYLCYRNDGTIGKVTAITGSAVDSGKIATCGPF